MPAPIPSNVNGLFDFQFHQVAIFCPKGVEAAVDHWWKLGYTNWIEDNAELKGILHMTTPARDQYDVAVLTTARMLFNYDIMPMELEFLEYSGPSRWSEIPSDADPFISHMSVYVDDVIADTSRLTTLLGYPPFHRFITQNHSNPGVRHKKRFIESIFDTRHLLGYDTKLIQKVPWDYRDEDWLDVKFVQGKEIPVQP